MSDRKLFAGPKLRRLRKSMSLPQARMAEELGISASYLNLMERNQRPITAQVLLKLAETYDVDLKELGQEPDGRLVVNLREAAGDPLLDTLALDRQDLNELLEGHPRAAEALIREHLDAGGCALLVTHDAAQAGRLATRAVTLAAGETKVAPL